MISATVHKNTEPTVIYVRSAINEYILDRLYSALSGATESYEALKGDPTRVDKCNVNMSDVNKLFAKLTKFETALDDLMAQQYSKEHDYSDIEQRLTESNVHITEASRMFGLSSCLKEDRTSAEYDRQIRIIEGMIAKLRAPIPPRLYKLS